jgi:non-specific serine/threonine protein kinase
MEKIISHFEILEKLGEGGMGMVYKAEDKRLNRIVALKFLSPDLALDEEAKKRFLYEAQSASSLQHNNICTIHDIDESEDGRMFICMDYYEGETLDNVLKKGPVPVDQALDIALQIASGLGKAHQESIIHRDIKPSNIFITKDGVVKILDFGLAKFHGITAITKTSETIGTAGYMSPEQASGGVVDQRTDIWALGVVIYEMITGKLPFKGEYEQAMVYSILNDSPEPPTALRTGLPIELDRIILKSLSKDPSDRYQHIDEMAVDLRKLRGSKDESNREVRYEGQNRRKRLFIPAVSAIVVIAVSLLVWMFVAQRSELKEKSKFIAVLPFHPITNSEEDSLFAEGIHDDILTQLSKISGLRVIARTSVMQYQNSDKSIKEIADELGVGTVLEGSTRRSGNVIRVTAQLIDSDTEEHLWAESYDRPYNDIFAIQSEVAQEIASALQVKLKEEEMESIKSKPTENLEAYEYFKKGTYYWSSFYNYDGNLKAAKMFEQACKLDSNFALAFAWQSRTYAVVASQTPNVNEWGLFVEKSRKALAKAESIDPDIPEVDMARGDQLYSIQHKIESALKEYEKANRKRPNDADILYTIAVLEGSLCNWQKCLELSKKIVELNPKVTGGFYVASWGNFGLGNYQESENWANRMISANPENGTGYAIKIRAQLHGYGDIEGAEKTLEESKRFVTSDKSQLTTEGFFVFLYKRDYEKALIAIEESDYPMEKIHKGVLLRMLGRNDESMSSFDSAKTIAEDALRSEPARGGFRMLLGLAYAGLGNKEKAMEEISLEDSVEVRGTVIPLAISYIYIGEKEKAMNLIAALDPKKSELTASSLKLDPRLDPLRDDPRFAQTVARFESGKK